MSEVQIWAKLIFIVLNPARVARYRMSSPELDINAYQLRVEPTSRCQDADWMCALTASEPVIPRVAFVSCFDRKVSRIPGMVLGLHEK